ncbi:MAG: hypothetical protein AAB955_04105 [Patescibacteria group bacterium]
MKKLFLVTILALLCTGAAQAASTDYYLKLGGVDGETKRATTARATTTGTVTTGESGEAEGKVEYEWKVEEGESAATPGVEPDEIDYNDDGEPLTPDFSILLGGGSDDDSEERLQGLARAEAVLLENAKASEQAIESVSLNFEKISTKIKHEVRLFGFIPATATATVDIDAEEEVHVSFPWWAIFATGRDDDAVGKKVVEAIANVLKTKHDTVKNAINNVR